MCRFTARITELIQVLDDLNKGKYERTMVADRNHKGKPRVQSHSVVNQLLTKLVKNDLLRILVLPVTCGAAKIN